MSAEELGVDERAQERLHALPFEDQQAILEKLAEGLNKGEIRNASAWVAKACTSPPMSKPEDLGIDDRALELLHSLPRSSQDQILAKLKNQGDVTNPSAWVAKACLKEKQNPRQAPAAGGTWLYMGGKGFGGAVPAPMQAYRYASAPAPMRAGAAMSSAAPSRKRKGENASARLGLDAEASELLSTLPAAAQADIMGKLEEEMAAGKVRNPSGWVVKAAINAKRDGGKGHMQMMPAYEMRPAPIGIDAEASEMLTALSPSAQADIMGKLQEEMAAGKVRNPSGWVVKAALNAKSSGKGNMWSAHDAARSAKIGGRGQMRPAPIGIDAEATEMLAALSPSAQADIMGKLQEEMAAGKVRNPSGWVVRAAINAKRDGGKGNFRPAPSAAPSVHVGLDAEASEMLATLSADMQADIVGKLEEEMAAGKVRNPSGWVVTAVINAKRRRLS